MIYNHLKFEDRIKLQYILETSYIDGIKFKDIARELNVNRSVIYNELSNHSYQHRSTIYCKLHCKKLLKSKAYVCNMCIKHNQNIQCTKIKRIYDAYTADERAIHKLKQSRRCLNKKMLHVECIEKEIVPLIKKGLSIENALLANNNTKISAMTIRRYIKQQLLSITSDDLIRKYRKYKDEYNQTKRKRVNVRILYKRLYSDYLSHMKSGKHRVLQVDLIIGKKDDKKAILTIFDPMTKVQLGFIVYRTCECVTSKILEFYEKTQLFCRNIFDVILTDNGVEMQNLPSIENDIETGEHRFKIFYCDPYRSNQKGGCERNHEFFRYMYKKGRSFADLSQVDVDEIFSHINSYPRKSLGNKSPYEIFVKKYNSDLLSVIGIKPIPLDDINFKLFSK